MHSVHCTHKGRSMLREQLFIAYSSSLGILRPIGKIVGTALHLHKQFFRVYLR